MATTALDLSPGMRAALVDAERCRVGGLAFVFCHAATRQALIRRGLAEEQIFSTAGGHFTRTVLTREGRQTAAGALDEEKQQ